MGDAPQPGSTVDRDALVAYLDELLDAGRGADYGPNGLQVGGTARIAHLVTGVSASLALFEAAIARGAQAVLVHHGLFWNGDPRVLIGWRRERVARLIQGDLNLLAYHLPLDRHPVYGNNALAAQALELRDLRPLAPHDGVPVGWAGTLPRALPFEEFRARVAALYGQEPLHHPGGPPELRRIGIVSGGAQRDLHAAIELDLDVFITGEVSEWVMHIAREAGIHFLACGHYATERLGVRALGEHLAARFGITVEFVDLPNPV